MLMETVSLDLTEVLRRVSAVPEFAVRLAVYTQSSQPEVDTLVAEAFPDLPEPSWWVYDYGWMRFLNVRVSGNELASWFEKMQGSLGNHAFALSMQPGIVSARRLPAHTSWDGLRPRWPYWMFEIPRGGIHANLPTDPLVADGFPFFMNLDDAVYALATFRVLSSASWVAHVQLSPLAAQVDVHVGDGRPVRLDLSGNGFWAQQPLALSGTVSFELPQSLPENLLLVLSSEHRWLDAIDLSGPGARWPSTLPNVTVDPPDVATLVEALRVRGEGPTIEFKSAIPTDSRKWTKTVAAFANAGGGWLLFGIEDGTGEVVGLQGGVGRLCDQLTDTLHATLTPEPPSPCSAVRSTIRRSSSLKCRRVPPHPTTSTRRSLSSTCAVARRPSALAKRRFGSSSPHQQLRPRYRSSERGTEAEFV